MNKIIYFSIVLVLISSLSFSQKPQKFFVGKKGDYVLLMDSDIKKSNKDQESAEIEVYVKASPNSFLYTLLVSKSSKPEFEKGNLLDGTYEKYYKENCNCEVKEIDLASYRNIQVLRHFITAKKGENNFRGINASFVSGQHLYEILFLTFSKDFENQKANFNDIMNTLIVNGKTTVDNYSEYKKSK